EDTVLVIRYCGPKGYPGMPEVANVPLPARLLKRGVRDMVRICDGRMSGTAYGTVVLHVAPEAPAGGPLALVPTADCLTPPPAPPSPARPRAARGGAGGGAPPPPGGPPRRRPPAGGPACTPSASSRPAAAPIWTSWSAPAATRSAATPTRHRARATMGECASSS